jgi:signal transduction histidine kinase
VSVRDNGSGFNLSGPRVGRGLDNIHERAAAVDAELEIDSAAGHGTLVRIAVPVGEE